MSKSILGFPSPDGDYLSTSATEITDSSDNTDCETGSPEPLDISDSCPEGGYGWVCVAATFLINAHTWGINSAFGVILAFYLSNNTFPGTTALEYAFVGGLSIACAMLASPLATHLTHRYGIHVSVFLGAILQAASFITTSFVDSGWQLFLSEGICFGVGMGFCFVGSVGVISHWFDKRRSLVNGIAAAGSGVGGLTYSLATGTMIPRLGFPWAMRILGIICLVVNLCCGCLLRSPPGHNHCSSGAVVKFTMLRKPQYDFLLSWGIMSALGYVALLFSISSYTVAVGLTQHQASIVSALLNLGQALGRPMVGVLSDSFGRVNVAFSATLFTSILCFTFWVFAKSMPVICVFAIIIGLGAGTLWAAAAPLTAEVVGLKDMSSALGLFWLALAAPTAVSEVIAVQLRDSTTDTYPYLRVQMFTGAMYASAALCLALLKVWPLFDSQPINEKRKQMGV